MTAALVILQAWVLADAISAVFLDGATLADVSTDVMLLCLVVVLRSGISYGSERLAFRTSAEAKSQLRVAVLEHAVELGPSYIATTDPGDLAQLTTRGIDALDGYFARYLPQLVLAVIIPITVGVAILTQDILATVIIALTLPLIPVFMILVGLHTQQEVDKQWRSLAQLSGYFLDIVSGLPTLKVFGRARAQAATLKEVGDRYRRSTMRVLRVSFLSSLVLELLATLSVALVAVSIGVRLVQGGMDLRTALIVLILAPEAYLPLRMVGTHYHAAADGIAASAQLLDILDEPLPTKPATDASGNDVAEATRVLATSRTGLSYRLTGVTAAHPGRTTPALSDVSAVIAAGRITALTGVSGSGKTTLLNLLLGFQEPQSGHVLLAHGDAEWDVSELPRRDYLNQIAWMTQSPIFIAGSVADNVRLGSPTATDAAVENALARAGLAEGAGVGGDPNRTSWLEADVGETGVGLSTGERRRVALARVLIQEASIVLLDEPSAALDLATEEVVQEAILGLRQRGATVVVVAHRPGLIRLADSIITLPAPTTVQPEPDRDDALRKRATLDLPGVRP